MFSCMGSQLDMGDRELRKALTKVHCTMKIKLIHTYNCNSAETKMLQSWLYDNGKIF